MRPFSSVPVAAALLSVGLLALARAGWVDPDTPVELLTTHSYKEGAWPESQSHVCFLLPTYLLIRPWINQPIPGGGAGVFNLVMSDEFDVVNRTFADGEDPTWTAGDHSDDARCVLS